MFDWLINELWGNIWNNVRYVIDTIAGPFRHPIKSLKSLKSGTLSMSTGAKRALTFFFVACVVITLGLLTWGLGLDRHASGPWFFRKTWMGWLALLAYFILKVFIAVLRQVSILPPLIKSWPDISRAIEAGQSAVSDAEFRIDQTPIFLVVGLSRDSEKAFVESRHVGDKICVDDPALPVHWYGDEEALWVTLPAVCCTSAQAERLRHFDTNAQLCGYDPDESMVTLTGKVVAGRDIPKAQRDVIVTANDRATARARIAYFCQELRELRDPVCAANGVLLMLPYNEAAMIDKHARALSNCVKADMGVLQEDLGVQCLTLTVMTANDDNPDFEAYIRNLSPDSIHRRCGVSFPQLLHLQNDDGDRVYDWLVRDFELQAMHLYREHPGDPDNESIFEFMDSFRNSKKFFANMISSAFTQDVTDQFYFGGLYLAELSNVGSESMPFMNGVLSKMAKEHDELISWSDRAIVDDVRNRRASYALFAVTAIVLLMSAGMVSNLVGAWTMTGN